MRIFGWAGDTLACGYLRIGLPMQVLAARGHETFASMQMPHEWRDADVIVAQRMSEPGPSSLFAAMAAEGHRMVYETDDDMFVMDESNPLSWYYRRRDVQARIAENARVATRVTVSTEPLAERMRQYADDVVVVPNYVPAALLEWERPRRERVTIGWAGSETHEMDWAEVRGPIRQFVARTPSVDFHAIGWDAGGWLGLPPDRRRFTGWFPLVEDSHHAWDFDIALAPLRPHPFNSAKSWIKTLEAAALGIPVVASAIRPYEDFVIDGVTGFLVARPHEWGRRLRELVEDADMRAEMGAKAREHARAFTIEGNVEKWERALTW